MVIAEIVNKNNIILDVDVKDKMEIFNIMAKKLYENKIINDIKGFIDAVIEREKEFSTGIGFEIAIPHAKSKYINKPSIAVARLNRAIEYESIDDEPVKLLFMIAVPESQDQEHLRILSILSRRFMDEKFRQALKNARNEEEMYKVICE